MSYNLPTVVSGVGYRIRALLDFCFTLKIDWRPSSINTRDLDPWNANHIYAKSCRKPLSVTEAHSLCWHGWLNALSCLPGTIVMEISPVNWIYIGSIISTVADSIWSPDSSSSLRVFANRPSGDAKSSVGTFNLLILFCPLKRILKVAPSLIFKLVSYSQYCSLRLPPFPISTLYPEGDGY